MTSCNSVSDEPGCIHTCDWKSVDQAITTPGFIYIQAQGERQSVLLYSTHLYPLSLSG